MRALSIMLCLLLSQQVFAQKSFEDNYLMHEDIERWVHYVKSGEFVSLESETEIQDVTEQEILTVYNYLEAELEMKVWNLSSITMFSTNLWYLNRLVEDGEVDLSEVVSQNYVTQTYYISSIRHPHLEEARAKEARVNSINTYLDIQRLLAL